MTSDRLIEILSKYPKGTEILIRSNLNEKHDDDLKEDFYLRAVNSLHTDCNLFVLLIPEDKDND